MVILTCKNWFDPSLGLFYSEDYFHVRSTDKLKMANRNKLRLAIKYRFHGSDMMSESVTNCVLLMRNSQATPMSGRASVMLNLWLGRLEVSIVVFAYYM